MTVQVYGITDKEYSIYKKFHSIVTNMIAKDSTTRYQLGYWVSDLIRPTGNKVHDLKMMDMEIQAKRLLYSIKTNNVNIWDHKKHGEARKIIEEIVTLLADDDTSKESEIQNTLVKQYKKYGAK
jgi:hypothetical protein